MPRGVYPRKPGSSYNTKHGRVRDARGLARDQDCEECGSGAHEWAMIHGTDGMRPEDFKSLCRSCHRKYDFKPEKVAAAAAANKGRKRPDLVARNKERTGWSHTPETRARIAEGMRRHRSSSGNTGTE